MSGLYPANGAPPLSVAAYHKGNLLGETMVLGTLDGGGLTLMTNNTAAVTIDANQDVTVYGDLVISGGISWTGQLLAPDGTVALPAYSFTNDPDCGVYRIGANNIGISANGVKQVDISASAIAFAQAATFSSTVGATTISASGVFLAGNGSVSACAFSFTADPNSGVYSVGADQVGISAGGALKVSVSGSTSSSTGGLVVTSGTAADVRSIVNTAGTVTGVVRQYFRNSDATRSFEIDADFTGAAESLVIQSESAGIAILTRAGQIQAIQNGSVGTPTYSFSGDPDCGVYRIGGDNLGVACNGAKVLDVATTGLAVTGAITASTSITATTTVRGTTGMRTVMSTADVSNPPTDAECIAAFGAAATVGAGFFAFIDDNAGHANEYLVFSDGTKYWQVTATACA